MNFHILYCGLLVTTSGRSHGCRCWLLVVSILNCWPNILRSCRGISMGVVEVLVFIYNRSILFCSSCHPFVTYGGEYFNSFRSTTFSQDYFYEWMIHVLLLRVITVCRQRIKFHRVYRVVTENICTSVSAECPKTSAIAWPNDHF